MTPFQQAQFNLCLARAAWWTAFANTPANLNRNVFHGDGKALFSTELIDDAMVTANTHLTNAQAILDQANCAS